MMDGSKFARESLGLRVEKHNVTEVIKKIEGQVNYNFNDHVMDNYSLRTFQPSRMMPQKTATNVSRKTLNARVAMTQEWDKVELVSGIDTQNNQHGTRKTDTENNIAYQDLPRIKDMEFQSVGAFGEMSYQLSDNNKLVSGIRLDQVKVDATQSDQERKETLPSAFLRFENHHPEHEDGKTYIGLGYVERMPDYWELFSPKTGNDHPNTFAHIDIEKTLQLDMGYQHAHGNFSSWASAYAGLINDYVLTTYKPTGMMNMLEAHSRNIDATIAGAEAGVDYQYTDHLQADVSAMYAWGENTTDHTPLPQISPLEARINLRYIQDDYTLGAYWRLVDSQNRISLNEGNIVGYDNKKSAGFGTLSLNGTYHVMEGVDLSVGVDNVFDRTYTEHLNKMGASGTGLPTYEQ